MRILEIEFIWNGWNIVNSLHSFTFIRLIWTNLEKKKLISLNVFGHFLSYWAMLPSVENPNAGDLKIVRINKVHGSCSGLEEIFIFVEQVNKSKYQLVINCKLIRNQLKFFFLLLLLRLFFLFCFVLTFLPGCRGYKDSIFRNWCKWPGHLECFRWLFGVGCSSPIRDCFQV